MDDLKFDKCNANKGTGRGKELLEQSIRELGAGRSILTDKDGNVIAGNKTLEAARKAGLKVRVITTSRDELVVVQREDLDLTDNAGEARRLAYLDNRVAEIDLQWDAEVIAADAEILDFDTLGFLDKELQSLLLGADSNLRAETTDPAELVEQADKLIEKWKIEDGQLWQLGNHRLFVGDCTKPEAMKALLKDEKVNVIWTDPPWNVAYGESDHPSWKKRTMWNDNLGDKFPEFIRVAVKSMYEASEKGAPIYLAMSAQEWPVIDKTLREQGFHWSSTIIWMKDQLVLSRKDYHTQFEPLWYGWRGDASRTREVVDRKQSDVWQIDRPKRSDEHPTMKPLALVERALLNSSLPNDVVLDPFAGSGTTLIVCEQMGRRCRTVELDIHYAAVVIERWAQFSGGTPVILSA